MRAIVQVRYGDDAERVLRVDEIARPMIGDDEVLVRVVAASIDMGTWHCMTGMPYAMRLTGFGVRSPKSIESRVEPSRGRSSRSAGTSMRFALGDEVYGTCDGSFAEFARVEPKMLAAKPANLSFEQAAAAPISGVTALQAVREGTGGVRTKCAGRRRVGRRRHLRRADRQGVRSRGHRRVQHREGGAGPITRRRPRHRLHAAMTSLMEIVATTSSSTSAVNRRLSHLRRALHPARQARHRRRRNRWTLARRIRSFTAGGTALTAREPAPGHARFDRELQ